MRDKKVNIMPIRPVWYTNKWIVLLLHAAAWGLLFSLPSLLRPPYEADRPHRINIDQSLLDVLRLINNLLLIVFFYLNERVLIPRLIYKKRYWQFAFIHILIPTAVCFGSWGFIHFIAVHTVFQWQPTVFVTLFPYLFILASSTAYRMIRDRIATERLAKERENENLKTELSFLRSQVSPHFMFNVLNNMVSLARKHSEQLEPSLIKLSSLMRYMLYEADEEKVPLEKETEYLQSYIDLQQQRFGNKIKVSVSMEEVDDRYDIEPMLLIPFVENAFKHGVGMVEDGQIHVHLKAQQQVLLFTVRNKYNSASTEIRDKTSGIGLQNVKRRLNLLYGGNHSLLITRQGDWFVISLQINLH